MVINFYENNKIRSVKIEAIRHYTYIKDDQRLVIYDGSTVEVKNFTEKMYWEFHKIVSNGEGFRFQVEAGW